MLDLAAVAQDVDSWEHALSKTRPFLILLLLPETTISGETLEFLEILPKAAGPLLSALLSSPPALFLLLAQIFVSPTCPRKLTFNPHEFPDAVPSTVAKTPVSAVRGGKMSRQ